MQLPTPSKLRKAPGRIEWKYKHPQQFEPDFHGSPPSDDCVAALKWSTPTVIPHDPLAA